jgi:phosphatidyl-myo-inositol dimannoside synthase
MAPLLFVSPCLCEFNFGGVQLSGRIARERLARENGELRQLCYGKLPGIDHGAECVPSPLQAALRAIGLRGASGDAVFWHIGMLKLLPLMGRRGRKVHLFLHGIESWNGIGGTAEHLCGSVDCFLTNSAFTWRRFTEKHPRWEKARHRVVPLGLGVSQPRLTPPAPIPAALVLGRMQKGEGYKGHEELIRAWPAVRRRVPSAELWIAGGGSLEPELKRIASEIGETGHVRFFGVISEEQKEDLLARAHCLALPSRGEGFGLAYLEAMRLGRPCLCSMLDAGREVVNPPEAGLAANPGESDEMSDAIVRLLTPGEEWDAWSARAKARYDSQFTAQQFGDRLVEALDR